MSIEERYALIENKVPKYLKEFAFRGAIDIQVKSLELLMHSTNLYSVIRQADEDRRALHGRWTEWRPEIKSDVIRISKRIVINVWNMMEASLLRLKTRRYKYTNKMAELNLTKQTFRLIFHYPKWGDLLRGITVAS